MHFSKVTFLKQTPKNLHVTVHLFIPHLFLDGLSKETKFDFASQPLPAASDLGWLWCRAQQETAPSVTAVQPEGGEIWNHWNPMVKAHLAIS